MNLKSLTKKNRRSYSLFISFNGNKFSNSPLNFDI